jgi:hypothetical protein
MIKGIKDFFTLKDLEEKFCKIIKKEERERERLDAELDTLKWKNNNLIHNLRYIFENLPATEPLRKLYPELPDFMGDYLTLAERYRSIGREDLAMIYESAVLKALGVPTTDDIPEQIDKKKIYEDFDKLYQKFSNHKQQKENKMKVRVKEEFLYLHDFSAKLKKFTPGIYEGEKLNPDNLIAINGVLLTPDVIRLNDKVFEIIEDWKPNPYHESDYLVYCEPSNGRTRWALMLTKKERALRKLQQIADHLNSLSPTDGTKYCIKHLSMLEVWCYGMMSKEYSPGEIYFYNMSTRRLESIISWMNNGDGISMDDLL